jgi:CHASE2 domain-containing sensor protein
MKKTIAIDFGAGDLIKGFSSITATLSDAGKTPFLRCKKSSLPPNPELDRIYQRWRLLYQSFAQTLYDTRMEIAEGTIERFSEVELKVLCHDLALKFNDWLNYSDFLCNIREPLSRKLQESDEIQVFIQTEDLLLRQFPWQLWHFFEHYPKAEVALSVSEFDLPSQSKVERDRVRILAILGDNTAIDLEKDRQQLEKLAEIEIEFLEAPSRQEFDRQLWDEKGWDIVFFAGHSQTKGEKGVISLNNSEKMSVDDLKYAFTRAIAQGLQLAIFNSCDGLGLAKQLEELNIPQVIVMRYPIPDCVAHEFLKYFLEAFDRENSLSLSLRKARERLQGMENKYPYASWLPVLCQNPAVAPLTWKALRGQSFSWRRELKFSLGVSLIVAGIIILIRSLGLLQPYELIAYDLLMRYRPNEGVDPRLLLITLTEADVQRQPASERGSASISDRTLDRLFSKLEQSQATTIGLDIYRENPVKKEFPALVKRMKENDRLFFLCKYGSTDGIAPPPELPQEGHGFNNTLLDGDDIIRRKLLAVESPKPCQNNYSLSLQIAHHYISTIHPDKSEFKPINSDGYIQIGTTSFKTLDKDVGGYRNLENRGHQILINYRNTAKIAETVTLTEFLERYPPEKIGQRIVLIGTVAPSFNDHRWYTPIGKMSGVEVQAHFVSQMLSTILDRRSLIWFLSPWGDFLWIYGWGGLGAIIGRDNRWKRRFLGFGVGSIVLGASCWGVLLIGGWFPLVPSLFAFGLMGGLGRLEEVRGG